MVYLDPSEYEAHGLEATTPASWVAGASALIDAHCRRPSLGVTAYTERLRLAPGRNTVRLTYLPLATVAPAESPLTEARVRYGVPRRGAGTEILLTISRGRSPFRERGRHWTLRRSSSIR